MAAVSTIISAIGVGLGAVSTVGGVIAAGNQAAATKRAEAARERAMNLDSMRRKREIIRQQELQRAQALSVATAQGQDTGSALGGAYGSISGVAGRNQQGVIQNQEIGADIFAANRAAADANTMSATFSGLGSLGSGLIKNAGVIDRVGSYLFGGNATNVSGFELGIDVMRASR